MSFQQVTLIGYGAIGRTLFAQAKMAEVPRRMQPRQHTPAIARHARPRPRQFGQPEHPAPHRLAFDTGHRVAITRR